MRRLIPPKTKSQTTIVWSLTLFDLLVFVIFLSFAGLLASTTFGAKWFFVIFLLVLGLVTVYPYGSRKGYQWIVVFYKYIFSKKKYLKTELKNLINCENGITWLKTNGVYTGVLEIIPIDFLILSENRQNNIIANFANVIKYIEKGSLVKLEKAIDFSGYVAKYEKLLNEHKKNKDDFISSKEKAAKAMNKKFDIDKLDLTAYNNIISYLDKSLLYIKHVNSTDKILAEAYYLAIHEKTTTALSKAVKLAIENLTKSSLIGIELTDENLTNFANNFLHLGEKEEFKIVYPEINENSSSLQINGEFKHIATIGKFPFFAEENAWINNFFSIDKTVATLNFETTPTANVVRAINKTILEYKTRYSKVKEESSRQDLAFQVESLEILLKHIKLGNENLHNVNFYIMFAPENKKEVERVFLSEGFNLNFLLCRQFAAWLSMCPLNSINLLREYTREIQSSALAASFPFAYTKTMDSNGNYLGDNRYPVFFDIWQRNTKRVNSNFAIFGQAGAGKTFLMRKLISQQLAEQTRVMIFDCENEYGFVAKNFGGRVIDVSGSGSESINPLQIFPALKMDEEEARQQGLAINQSDVSLHRQFLSEWFDITLPQLDLNTKATLNNIIGELYIKFKIYDSTDISTLKANQFPTFDNLLAMIEENQRKKGIDSSYKENLNKLLNLIKQFSKGGMMASLWNKHTTLDVTQEKFVVFNFQNLFANNNTLIANAQLLLVTRLLMREAIKNREYNLTKKQKFHILYIVDEAHRYISPKYTQALDMLEQNSRRLRKYDCAQGIASQSISEFVGNTIEIQTKSQAVINNCLYSFIFGLKAADTNKLVELYKNYGDGLTNGEIKFVSGADRGQALFLIEAEKRTVININVLPGEKEFFLPESV